MMGVIVRILTLFKELFGFFRNRPRSFNSNQSVLQQLIDLCWERAAHPDQLYHDIFDQMAKTARELETVIQAVQASAPNYDLPNASKPANGYRSFVDIVDKAATRALDYVSSNSPKKDTLLELTALLNSLLTCSMHLMKIMDRSEEGSLYPIVENGDKKFIRDILQHVDMECFYGQFIANQFDDKMRFVLKRISEFMVCYSEIYYEPFGFKMMRNIINYLMNEKDRGAKHVQLAQHCGIDFIQKFWSYSECQFMKLPMRLTNPIAVSCSVTIEKSSVTIHGTDCEIKPTHHVTGLLLSKTVRHGMHTGKSPTAERSRGLVLHVHGGGFVSQSPQSQEIFLRKWATALDVPVFSLDYSLAPGAAFPQAVYQVFHSYCVAITFADEYLGSTAERVVFAGDSAGGNIIMGAMQLCIENGVRLPNGILLAYVPFLLSSVPSPARLLGVMDPLLPYGLMMRCAKAYILGDGSGGDLDSLLDLSFPHNPLISPYICSNDILRKLPQISLYASTLDPCLDDAIMFAKKLQQLGNQVQLDVADNLPHGFLNLCWVNENAREATKRCGERISSMLNL